MERLDRFRGITEWFMENRPNPKSELHYGNPYELLVATMLSAQCTDARVNMVMPSLTGRYPTPEKLAAASAEDVIPLIRSISYPNAKAAHLVGMARKVVSDFGGEIPRTVEELMTLPGVGRKTANVLTSILYGNPVIAVDTHVFRVAHRLGLSDGATPDEVEADLEAGFPAEIRPRAHHWLLLHGRYICKSRSPLCKDCALSPWCLHQEEAALQAIGCSCSARESSPARLS